MNASAILHTAALAICFAAHFSFAEELDGVRRAMETLKPVSVATAVAATAQA